MWAGGTSREEGGWARAGQRARGRCGTRQQRAGGRRCRTALDSLHDQHVVSVPGVEAGREARKRERPEVEQRAGQGCDHQVGAAQRRQRGRERQVDQRAHQGAKDVGLHLARSKVACSGRSRGWKGVRGRVCGGVHAAAGAAAAAVAAGRPAAHGAWGLHPSRHLKRSYCLRAPQVRQRAKLGLQFVAAGRQLTIEARMHRELSRIWSSAALLGWTAVGHGGTGLVFGGHLPQSAHQNDTSGGRERKCATARGLATAQSFSGAASATGLAARCRGALISL